MWKSADGLGEWPSESIGAIHEIRVFVIPSDAVVVGGPFEVARTVLGSHSRVPAEGEGGVAEGWAIKKGVRSHPAASEGVI